MKSILILLCLAVMLPAAAQKKSSGKKKPDIIVADSLFLQQRYGEAVPFYESAMREPVNTPNAQGWNRLALSHLHTGNYQAALSGFAKVYQINPLFPQLFVNQAKAYCGLNEVTKAIALLDSALVRAAFGNYKLLESDPLFANLRKDARYQEVHNRVYVNAYPCLRLPEARQFDFWLGDWDVYVTANPTVKAGFNRITRLSGGCVIFESWEAVGPHNGVSINYYDPADSTWKQKWAGSGQDILEFYDGKRTGNAMQFRWDVRGPDGTIAPGRLTFTELEPGKVRQHSERSADQGKTWTTVYDFTYIRRSDSNEPD